MAGSVSKKDKEYWAAKKRLEKTQAQYITKPKKVSNKPMTAKEKKAAEQRTYKRYNERVWKGWRETDGKKYPVEGSGAKSANKKKI